MPLDIERLYTTDRISSRVFPRVFRSENNMTGNEQPDQKPLGIRPRSTQQSRELPQLPPPSGPFKPAPPFSRSERQPRPLDTHRRLSEHGQYEPDPRGPSPGPSHGYQNTIIKRDPSDEPHHSQYRAPATEPTQDHAVAAPPPERYHHPPLNPSPTSAPFPSQFAPPQSPMAVLEPYGQYNGYPQHGRESYQTMPYSASAAAANAAIGKKKAKRAAQACDSFRTLKAKCDEGRPHCSSCKEKGTPCGVSRPSPKAVCPPTLF